MRHLRSKLRCVSALLLALVGWAGHAELRADSRFEVSKIMAPGVPRGSAICDLNGDGLPDAALGSAHRDRAMVFHNQADGLGTLGFVAEYPTGGVGHEPHHMACGDLDNDEDLDLLVMGISSQVYVMLNQGDGSYSPGTLVPGAFFGDISLADFNNDGIPDFVTGLVSISVHLGVGDGSFEPAIVLPVATQPYPGMATGDLNGDGNDDIVAGLNVRLGNGDGTFSDPGSLTCQEVEDACNQIESAVIADFGGDGIADIALGNPFLSVAAYRGNGDGTFSSGRQYLVPDTPYRITAGDLDRDGRDDLVAAYGHNGQSPNPYTLSVLMGGDADGLLNEPNILNVTRDLPVALELADFSGDGRLDLLFADGSIDDAVILLGRGDGTFRIDPLLPGSGAAVVTGHFDASPFLDTARAGSPGQVEILSGDGAGSFQVVGSAPVSNNPSDLLQGDFDRDGFQDLVTVHYATPGFVTWIRGLGNGQLQTGGTYSLPTLSEYGVTADFNDDTLIDLVVLHPQSSSLSFLAGNGDGTFAAATTIPLDHDPRQIAAGMIDGDSHTDLAVTSPGGDQGMPSDDLAWILLGNGDGTFSLANTLTVQNASALALGDLDGSAGIDLAVGGFNTAGDRLAVSFFSGNGDGSFGPPVEIPTDGFSSTLQIEDLNADGNRDLVGGGGNAIYQVSGNGDGTFEPPVAFSAIRAGSIATGDFNEDGRNDLISTQSILINRCGDRTLRFSSAQRLEWLRVCATESYEIYRGLLSNLVDTDSDGLPDSGYGACINGSDPDPTDERLNDPTIPAIGDGFFYLMQAAGNGGPSGIGTTGQGVPRPSPPTCP